MNMHVYAVLALNFAFIGLLPILFFKRDGKLNAFWWLTATPFLVAIGSVTACLAGFITPLKSSLLPSPAVAGLISITLSVLSIALITYTWGTHRIPIALWHQVNDAPQEIVTWGPYRHVRHPFYCSFLLTFLSTFMYCPQLFTAAALVWGVCLLTLTAKREEERLSNSQFGAAYKTYMSTTGRFLPKAGGHNA